MTRSVMFGLGMMGSLVLFGLGCSSSPNDGQGERVRQTEQALSPVTWTSAVGVDATANNLTKTGTTTGWNAGAVSNETISGDGYVEFATSERDSPKMIGLSSGNSGESYADIDFAMYLTGGGEIRIYEGGVYKGTFGTYLTSNTLRVQVVGSVVSYLQNGTLLYTSTGTPAFPLLVDTSLYSTGGTLTNVVLGDLSSAVWQNAVGVTTAATSVTKTSATTAWNAGASTTAAINTASGYAQFSAGETTTGKMAGLSNGDSNVNYTDIDFAIYMQGGGTLSIYEAGVKKGTFGTYTPTDVFRVQADSGVVTYAKNGVVFYTSASAPTLPLLLDTSLYNSNASIKNIVVANMAGWQNISGVTTTSTGLTKFGPTGWNSGASTVTSFSGDGYCQFSTGELTTLKMAGLSHGDADQSYIDIDYAIYLAPSKQLIIYEGGVSRGTVGSYASPSDVFKVASEGGVVKYYKNGTLLYTSTVAPTAPLLFDTSLYTPGATITNVVVGSSSGTWTNPVGVSASGASLTKTGTTAGWNAGAASAAMISGDGYMTFTTVETNTNKMAGLSAGDANQSEQDIDFAIGLVGTNVYVYEAGISKGQFGTCVPGDVFKVETVGSVVTYYKNDELFYTSTATPSFPLLIDTSLYDTGATINDTMLVTIVSADVLLADNCAATFAPTEIVSQVNRPIVVRLGNTSASYHADMWSSYGSGTINVPAGSSWTNPDLFCLSASPTTGHIDVFNHDSPYCSAKRLTITCQ